MEINEIIKRDINLITLVERFPHLYDKSSAKYRDRTAVDNSWLFISGELRISAADCISRWTSLRNRFSKERAKKTPSGSAAQTEWPLMKYLAFLHSVVRKRRTFGNIRMTNDPFESNVDDSLENCPESQNFDEDSTSYNTSLIDEKDDSIQYMNYEYLNEEYFNETDSTDTHMDIPIVEESFESLSNFPSENIFHEQQTSSSTFNTSIQRLSNTCIPHRPTMPNTSTPHRPTTPNTCTPYRPTTPNTYTPHRPTMPNTSTPHRPTPPNTCTPHRPTTPNTSTPHRLTTPNTSTPRRPTTPNTSTPHRPTTPNTSTPNTSTPNTSTPNTSTPNTSIPRTTSRKRKQPSDVDTQLTSAVDAFKNYVTCRNTANAENDSLKNFCDSLYGDLKNIDKKDLISCKIEIMQIISKYIE